MLMNERGWTKLAQFEQLKKGLGGDSLLQSHPWSPQGCRILCKKYP